MKDRKKGSEKLELRDSCINQLQISAVNYIKEEKMMEYLELVSKFPQMPYYNILLIMRQFPGATVLCGVGAWKRYRAALKESAKPVVLLSPKIIPDEEGDIALDIQPVTVVDISQVNLSSLTPTFSKAELNPRLEEILRESFEFTIFDDDGRNIPLKFTNSILHNDELTIYVRKGLDEEKRLLEIIKRYIEHLVLNQNIVKYSNELVDYIEIIVRKYFGLNCDYFRIVPSKLFQDSIEEKFRFLQYLSDISFEAIQNLSTHRLLSFNQTAFCNEFFTEPDRTVIIRNMSPALEMTKNIYIGPEIMEFFHDISKEAIFSDEVIKQIFDKRITRELFIFPPTQI